MKTRTKVWLMIAAFLVLIGCILFGGVMTMFNWDFTKLSTGKYEKNDYKIQDDYQHISIITDTADIMFVSCESQTPSVSCYEQKNNRHSVSVKDGTLEIRIVDTRKWYEHIGINFGAPKITVYIPAGEYGKLSVKASTGNVEIPEAFKFRSMDISVSTGDVKTCASVWEGVKIKTTTGSICMEDTSAGSLDLSVSTGKVTVSGVTCEGDAAIGVSTGKAYLTDTRCKSLISSGSTGDISLNSVIAAERLSIQRSTGDVIFESCDAGEIYVKTDTGDVTGSLLSDKVFITQTDTGSISVPDSVAGGRCEITTDTGDIDMTVVSPDAVQFLFTNKLCTKAENMV